MVAAVKQILHITTLVLVAAACGVAPAFADAGPMVTVDTVLGVMRRLPEERCLYNPHGKNCELPGGYDRGPDAHRIADAIAKIANGCLTGDRAIDAAVMATFSSYESGNNAEAAGDCKGGTTDKAMCAAHGAWQIQFVSPDIATDPYQAAATWLSIARSSMSMGACASNPPDERLAGIAGSCTYGPARRKVRQRVQAARAATGLGVAMPFPPTAAGQ